MCDDALSSLARVSFSRNEIITIDKFHVNITVAELSTVNAGGQKNALSGGRWERHFNLNASLKFIIFSAAYKCLTRKNCAKFYSLKFIVCHWIAWLQSAAIFNRNTMNRFSKYSHFAVSNDHSAGRFVLVTKIHFKQWIRFAQQLSLNSNRLHSIMHSTAFSFVISSNVTSRDSECSFKMQHRLSSRQLEMRTRITLSIWNGQSEINSIVKY